MNKLRNGILSILMAITLFSINDLHAQKALELKKEKIKAAPQIEIDKDNMKDFHQFSEDEMKKMWDKFSSDAGFKELMKQVNEKGFKRINIPEAAWGFKAKGIDKNSKKEVDLVYCAYDFYNPKAKKGEGQGCSMIWRKVGDEVYKAYLIFPEGEKNMEKALESSQEWFVNDKNKVEKASSWGRCFRRCIQKGNSIVEIKDVKVRTNCHNSCLGAVAICGAVTAGIAASTAGMGVPAAIALFFGCAGVGCAPCFAACALGCI